MLKVRKKKNVLFRIALLCMIIGLVVFASPGYAQGRYKGEWVLPKHYPQGFDGWGRIDRISDGEVVIDDTMYPLSPAVTYNIPEASNINSSFLRAGDMVGYLMDQKGFIISLWRIP
jgi:hypothetical protein